MADRDWAPAPYTFWFARDTQLWMVGHYDADRRWHTDSEHKMLQHARGRCAELNQEANR